VPIIFPYDFRKAAQAVGLLLNVHHADQMSCSRILHLLYLADRNSIQMCAQPLAGDTFVVTPNGPMPVATRSILQSGDFCVPEWAIFSTVEENHIKLTGEPGIGKLSPFDVTLLTTLTKEFVNEADAGLRKFLLNLTEVKPLIPQEGSVSLPIEDIARAVGRDIEHVEEAASVASTMHHLFGYE
jgi:hypothetical protein